MKIAIHNSISGFHPHWEAYCKEQNIPTKKVDCHANDIIQQLSDCDSLMWHFGQSNPKDILVAKQLLFSLEHSGFKTFPNFKTAWHFDDKIGQKYLLEKLGLPLVPSYIFLNKASALDWANNTHFPKVFKLRGGAGSANVKLVKNKNEAIQLINKAFGKGFKQYEAWSNLSERWRKFGNGKTSLYNVFKGIIRLGNEPQFSKTIGRERGYAYFQDFVPGNNSDTRIIVINNKAFGIKRMVRKNDFRASGSGDIIYDQEEIDKRCVQISFDSTDIIQSQCAAFDFVFDEDKNPLLVEVSYGFSKEGYDPCPGYWDQQLKWHEGRFNPQGWMVEVLFN